METDKYIPPPRTMMEVFRCLPEGTLVELIENKLVLYAAPFDKWHVMREKVWMPLSFYIKDKKPGRLIVGPVDVYLDDKNAFQPDFTFVSNERMHILKEDGIYGPPDLIIRISSHHNAKYDLKQKMKVYERNGVKEYWVVDPSDNSTTGYYLTGGKYREFFTGVGRIELKTLDLQYDLNYGEYF